MDLRPPLPELRPLARPAAAAPVALGKPALALGGAGKAPDRAQIEKVARDFEAVFARQLISSMRDAGFGDALFPGQSTHFRDLYDQQLAKTLSSAGAGLGLAPVIARQLSAQAQPADARSDDDGGPAALLPLTRPQAATAAATPAASGDGNPVPGSYHRPHAATPPAWLSRGGEVKPNGHIDLTPATPASRLPDDRFSLTPPLPSRPEGTPLKAGSPDEFVASIWPQAQRAAAELGVDPKMLVAQAALETGWGRHVVGRKDGRGGNLFGIKAGGSWQGQAVTAATREFNGGAMVQEHARFRAYDSVEASFDDYVALLKGNRRYAAALGTGENRRGFADALARGGYATDPHYARKLVAIAEGPTLRRALAALNPEPALAANEIRHGGTEG